MFDGLVSPTHLMFLLILAVLLFGSKRLPEMARSLGNGMREFKETMSGMDGVTETVNGVREIHSAVSPTNIARAAVPGVADLQDSIGAAKDLVNPFAAPPAAAEAEAAADAAPPAAPQP
jgi:sec-independent protein translocase protein TatA